MFDWRRAVVFVHRWLGVAGCLLFLAWFASGIVMMYARMPELSRAERRARLPRLDLSRAILAPRDAIPPDLKPSSLRIGMLGGRPVYRVLAGRDWLTFYADAAERFAGLSRDGAVEEAKRFAPEHAATIGYDARLVEPDQWTLQDARSLPMHRVTLGDADGTVVYFAERTGEPVVKTTTTGRRVAYAGAVLHWLYFTPFRKHHALWTQSIVWLSLLGIVMCLLGLVWGFYNWARRPYRGWLQWHHYAGLAFGVFTLAWIFSGLLSVDPWDWHAETVPTTAQQEGWSGGPLDLGAIGLPAILAPLPAAARELEIVSFRGQPRVIADGSAREPLGRDALAAALTATMPGVEIADVEWLGEYDDYYYDRAREQPLPVVRARFRDASATWLYVDPNRGTILRREERSSRVNRWLYHGLHSLDFPFLYRRRPLWDIVMILLILGGMGSAATAVVPASRRLWRHVHRLL